MSNEKQELEVLDKFVALSEQNKRLLGILKSARGDRTFNDTVGFLLLNVEDIKRIADKEEPENG
jgi:hypothetical protein